MDWWFIPIMEGAAMCAFAMTAALMGLLIRIGKAFAERVEAENKQRFQYVQRGYGPTGPTGR